MEIILTVSSSSSSFLSIHATATNESSDLETNNDLKWQSSSNSNRNGCTPYFLFSEQRMTEAHATCAFPRAKFLSRNFQSVGSGRVYIWNLKTDSLILNFQKQARVRPSATRVSKEGLFFER
jgi:hypothetical protein